MKTVILEKNVKPFTKKQLIDRANRSNQDYLNGKCKTQEELEIQGIIITDVLDCRQNPIPINDEK